MHRFQHTAMATQFEVRSTHPDALYARQAVRVAFEAVDRLEGQLSRFVENSDVSRINHLAPGEATIVGYETMQCLQLARHLFEETGGAFDPAKGSGFGELTLFPGEFGVQRQAGADAQEGTAPQLDLGAIGKGYAVDRMAAVLEDWEIREALLDGGCSSVLALDAPAGGAGWPLTLSRPGDGVVLARLEAADLALGASGIEKTDHIWNPRAGVPVRERQAAWVAAPRRVLGEVCNRAGVEPSPAAVADALSTAFMICAPDEIEGLCRKLPGLEAWILQGEFFRFPTDRPDAGGGPASEPER